VRGTLTAAGNTRVYLPELQKLGIDDAEKLEMRAHALSYAQALHSWTLSSPLKIDELAREVTAVRRLLISELDLLVLRGVIASGAVKPQTTNSYIGTAHDVRVIGSAFIACWEKVGPQIGNDKRHVDAALHGPTPWSKQSPRPPSTKRDSRGPR
jgi:hypothetical protein